jgi:hypothetical protein
MSIKGVRDKDPGGVPMGQLYFGDNLDILREHIPNESVDLTCLDPPFNSKRGHNLLFNFPKIQILTIEGLLSGAEAPTYPDLSRGALSFKKAKTEKIVGEQQPLF